MLTLLAVLGIAVGAYLWVRMWRTIPDDEDDTDMVRHIRRHYPEDQP